MLVLSRNRDEWVGIEIEETEALAILRDCGKIRIDVLLAEVGDKVKLGFAADDRITIHRQEVWDEIRLRSKAKAEQEAEVADLAEITAKAF